MSAIRVKKRLWAGLTATAALILGLIVAAPLIYGVAGAFKSKAEFAAYPPTFLPRSFLNFENFRRVLDMAPVGRYFVNSLIVALLTSLVRLALAVLAAYAFAFFDFAGKRALFLAILGTMMLPADTLLVTNYQTVTRLNLLDSYLGICVTSFVGASQMFMLRQCFRASPTELREAAQLDGCGDMRFIARILLPVSVPVLTTLFMQSFIAAWNGYLWPLMVTNHNDMRTFQVGIAMLTTIEDSNYEVVLAGVTLSLIPALALFLALRRSVSRGMMGGALVG